MIVVNRFEVAEAESDRFLARARVAVSAMAGRPGFRSARIGRAADAPSAWVLVTEWAGVGAYRRALSSYDVKVGAHPLLGEAVPEPSAFEVLYAEEPGRPGDERTSGRAGESGPAG